MAKHKQPDVFSYLDYRAFLQDFYTAKKEENSTFSFRSFARRVGVRGPSHLKRIIDGERSLSGAMIERYAHVIGLDTEEAQYFSHLIRFNDARKSADREKAYENLTRFKRYRRAHQLDYKEGQYFGTWYIPAIRELVVRKDFDEDPAWIAEQLRPSITIREVKSALSTLFELNLLVRDNEGRIRQSDPMVSTGSQTRSVHIACYHRVLLERASEAIDLFSAQERDLSGVTLCIGKNRVVDLKKRIAEFRKELLARFDEEEGVQVVQVSFQLFPLTNEAKDE